MAKRKIKKIVLIEPKESGWNVFSLFKIPRLGVPILGTILRDRGYQVTIFVEKIGPIDWDIVRQADFVGISVVSNTAFESYKMAKEIRSWGTPVVFGGPHASFEPEEAIQYADYVLRGEGEEPIVALVNALEGKAKFDEIPALTYWKNGRVIANPSKHFCQNIDITPDFTLVHGFKKFYDRRWHLGFAPLEVLSTRGCPYGCKFCSVIKMSGRKMRNRTVDDVIDEIEHLVKTYRKNNVFFVDDNFTANRNRAKEILQKIIDRKIPVKLSAQVRVETAQDKELMELMHKAGMHVVQIGLESVNPDTLKAYDKKQDVATMKKSIQTFNKYGIFVFGMFIVGSDYDTAKTARATVEFAKKLGLVAIELLALGPLPGTDLTAELQRENRIITRDWTRYDGNHVLIFAKRLPPSILQKSIIDAYKHFYTLGRAWRYLWKRKGMYVGINLYGFLVTRYLSLVLRPYVKFLRRLEKNKYRKTSKGFELIEPIEHTTEETPLDYPSQKFIYRLFGPRARTYADFSYKKEFPRSRLQPVVLSLPEDLSDKISEIPNRLSEFLARSKRPVVIDFSKIKISDTKFWVQMSGRIKPFSDRVRLNVASGTKEAFRKLHLKILQKIAIK